MPHRWWTEVQRALNGDEYRKFVEESKTALDWYTNQEKLFKDVAQKANWHGMTVQGNMYQRDVELILSTVWNNNPKLSIRPSVRDDAMLKFASALEAMASKIFTETGMNKDFRGSLLNAIFSNCSYIKLEYDRFRQLPVGRHTEEKILVDPGCKGNWRNANWVAEVIVIPFIDFYQDDTFDIEKREKLRKILTTESGEERFRFEQTIELAYIWSKKGANPWADLTGRKLIVVTNSGDFDEPLLVDDWPWTYLDHDHFPIYQTQLTRVPGTLHGINLFTKVKALYDHYNFAASFNMEDARISAQRKVLYNEQMVSDPKKITSGNHLEPIACQGNLSEAMLTIDFGAGSPSILNSFQMAKEIHDDQTGINELARGDSPGDRATAEEVRTRKRGVSTVFKLFSDAVDEMLMEFLPDFVGAILMYVPQWGRVVLNSAIFEARATEQAPIDPMTGQPAMDPMTGQPAPPSIQWEYLPIDEEEGASLPDPLGMPDGYVIRPGVNNWIGIEHALNWQEYDIEQIKRDYIISVEAGSTRSEHAIEEQRNALTLLQTIGPLYEKFQCFPELYELVRYFVLSLRIPGGERFIPDRAKFEATGFIQEQTPEDDVNSQGGVQEGNSDNANPIQQPPQQTFGGVGSGSQGVEPFGQPEQTQGLSN